MALTTAAAFDEFKTKIALTANQKEIVAGRQRTAESYLTSAFGPGSTMPLKSTTLIGSAGRDVIIRPLDDVDLLAVFNNKNGIFETYRYDSQAFLYRVRNALNQYQVKVVGARGQAVRLFYNQLPNVDIAPVFKWAESGYGLPNGTGGWSTTDPIFHASYMASRNAELGYHLKPLVRLLKRWNNEHSKRLKSFHLEALVSASFVSLSGDSRAATSMFFGYARNHLGVPDPAGHSSDLSSYLTPLQRTNVVSSMDTAQSQAVRAISAEGAGNHQEAIRLWRLVFGSEFPSYG